MRYQMRKENQMVEILLVEDSKYDAEMTIKALSSKSLVNNLHHVSDGEEALDFLFCRNKFAERQPDQLPKLILLDLKMPKVNGFEVLWEIKANENTKKIPVVILTSSKENPDIQTCYDYGANSYIVKPVGFDDFVTSVVDLGMYWLLLNNPPK